MPGTRNSSVGRWEHGRSEDRDSQRWLAAPISREARLIPEGIGVTREGWLASGWCGPLPEADSVHTVACAGAHTVAQWATAQLASPGRGLWGETRRSSLLNRIVDYVNTADQAVLEARGLLPPERVPAETAAGWTTCSSAFRSTSRPGAVRLYSSGHTKARRSGVRFRCSRRSTPSDCSDGHCLISPSGDGWLTVATLAWAGARLSRSPRAGGAGLRGGQVHPLLPKQRAHPEVGGPRTGQVRPPGPASRSQ